MMRKLGAAVVVFAVATVVALLGAAGSASAAMPFKPHLYSLSHFFTEASDTQAGGHPDVRANLGFNHVGEEPDWETFGRTRRLEFDLPFGLVGDPTAFPKCSRAQFHAVTCPPQSQVGMAHIQVGHQNDFEVNPLYNMEPGPESPARFGIMIAAGMIYSVIDVKVRPDGGLMAIADEINMASPLLLSDVTMWGVPYDSNVCNPNHPDFDPNADSPYAGNRSGEPCPASDAADWERKPFMAAPTDCGVRPETRLRAFSYEGFSDAGTSYDPFPTGCDQLEFEPEVSVRPTNTQADGVSGLDVEITVPQPDDPDGLVTPHLRDATVVLPEGVSINPGLARGLEACADVAFGKGVEGPANCPAASKVGSLRVDTPLLDEPLGGDVFVGEPLPGNRYRLFLYIRGRGVIVKLVGSVRPDPVTGQITTTFRDNPPMPFSKMTLNFQGGNRGVLAMPQTCGTKTTTAAFTPFSTPVAAHVSSSFGVSWDGQGAGCPAGTPFEPGLSGGSVNPAGGSFSPFAMTMTKPDRSQSLAGVNVELPKGFLAKVKDVPLCADHLAEAGACPASTRVGKVTVGSGPGGSPFFIDGTVSLTGPYKSRNALPGVEGSGNPAPYGLVVAVHAIAGPYDLGMVVVRQSLHVDPQTAEVTAISDPLPTILEGVPLRLQRVDVDIDRPGFAINPTSCTPKRLATTFSSTAGALAERSTHYQAAGCKKLKFKPRLKLGLTGRQQTKTGRHPGVKAVVRQTGVGESGIGRARVVLPKSLALDPENAQALCEFEDGTKPDLENHCPKGSIVGRARAKTPLLNEDLVGDVYFVKNVRRSRSGNLVRTLPMLVVALRGEIAINLTGKSSTTKGSNRLVNTFASVPDAPISRFNLNIKGGSNGILAVTGTRSGDINLCAKPRSHTADTAWRAQSGKRADYRVRVKTPCAKRKAGKRGGANKGSRR